MWLTVRAKRRPGQPGQSRRRIANPAAVSNPRGSVLTSALRNRWLWSSRHHGSAAGFLRWVRDRSAAAASSALDATMEQLILASLQVSNSMMAFGYPAIRSYLTSMVRLCLPMAMLFLLK